MLDRSLPVKAVPYRHQREAFAFACRLLGLSGTAKGGAAALLMEMGTGKTITAIAIAGALAQAGRARRALVVAPLSILGVWQDEFQKFAGFDYSLAVLNGDSLEKKRKALKRLSGDGMLVAVVNYESMWRMEKELREWRPDLIIADEGHKIKTHDAAVSKAMHRLGARTPHKLLLTGTIVTNKALDIFSPYKFLNPGIFGDNFRSFQYRYFFMTGYGNYTAVLNKSMEPELTEKLHSIAFRATKAECLDLPETTEIIRHVELEPRAEKLYKNLAKDSYAELGKTEVTANNVLTRALRLLQLTGGFLPDDGGAVHTVSKAKLDALEDIIDDARQEGKKVVVIAWFVPEIRAICKMLESRKIGYSCIMGEVKNREAQVAAFQNDPAVTVFVGQISTAGLGLTLTAASTMVFYSANYNMSDHEQAKARIHRVGQRENCAYIYLAAKNTMDEKVLKALREKADFAKMLIDDYRNDKNPFEGGAL
jgi:SNF2 family DNA or RNA helicase